MKTARKLIPALLCLALVLTFACLVSPISAQAAGERPTYKDYVFTEDFESDLSKWEEGSLKAGNVSDFAIVDDPNPSEEDPDNKVLGFSKQSVFYIPVDEYWPADGQMATATFRMLFTEKSKYGLDRTVGGGIGLSYKDSENFNTMTVTTTWGGKVGIWAKYRGIFDGEGGSGGGAPDPVEFNTQEWFDVTVYYDNTTVQVVFKDNKDRLFTMNSAVTVVDGKFPLGSVNWNGVYPNYDDGALYYVDDLEISFNKLTVDVNLPLDDVNVYFAGNSVYDPGDLLSITGEQLGTSVSAATILKMEDTALSSLANDAKFVNETDYEFYNPLNVTWEQLQEVAVPGSERPLDILQKSRLGLKVSIPNDGVYTQRGMYAIRLTSAAGGKDAIVIVNNPQVSFLLHDDGEAATPNGWLKIAGYNLSLQDDPSKVSAIIIDSNGKRTWVDNSKISVDVSADDEHGRTNNYYVMVQLDNLPTGSYQVMLHNSYGGDMGWSMPYAFTVKAAAARDSWNQTVFNVKDYGAVGDSYYNDTAAFVQALAAAQQAGGGTVYFPTGFYRITDTLYIPDKVSLVGDGQFRSVIFWDANNWIEIPDNMIVYEDNVEFRDFYVYGSVTKRLFHQQATGKHIKGGGHVYFENVKVMLDFAQYYSNGRGNLMEGYVSKDVNVYMYSWLGKGYDIIEGFRSSDPYCSAFNYFNNVEFYNYGVPYLNGCGFDIYADYMYAKDLKFDFYSKVTPQEAAFFEDLVLEDGALNYYGNCFFNRFYGSNSTNNNREILLTDGQPKYKRQQLQGLNDDTVIAEVLAEEKGKLSAEDYNKLANFLAKNKGYAFRCTTGKIYYNMETASLIYVVKGQGTGQVRELEQEILQIGDYSYMVVKNKFAIDPNRNSLVYIYGERSRAFLVNSGACNTATFGVYGSFVDLVTDGIYLDQGESGVRFSPSQGHNWYFTNRGTVATNILTGHTTAVEIKGAALSYGSDTSAPLAYLGIRLYGNFAGQAGYYGSTQLGKSNAKEIILENNVFYSTYGPGIRDFKGGAEGMYFRGNVQYDEQGTPASMTHAYDDDFIKLVRSSTQNKWGYYDLICDVIPNANTARLCGDVNNDGQINETDLDWLSKYLSEEISQEDFTDRFGKDVTKYADCDGKAGVDIRDLNELAEYLRYKLSGDLDSYTGNVGTTQTGSGSGGSSGTTAPAEEKIDHLDQELELDYSRAEEEGNPDEFVLDYSGAPEED